MLQDKPTNSERYFMVKFKEFCEAISGKFGYAEGGLVGGGTDHHLPLPGETLMPIETVTDNATLAEKVAIARGLSTYDHLRDVLDKALVQAALGKGAQRHNLSGETPFERQRMQTISELIDSGKGMEFQIIKKLTEGVNLPTMEARERELLGVINYTAGLLIYLHKQESKRVMDDLASNSDDVIETYKSTVLRHGSIDRMRDLKIRFPGAPKNEYPVTERILHSLWMDGFNGDTYDYDPKNLKGIAAYNKGSEARRNYDAARPNSTGYIDPRSDHSAPQPLEEVMPGQGQIPGNPFDHSESGSVSKKLAWAWDMGYLGSTLNGHITKVARRSAIAAVQERVWEEGQEARARFEASKAK